MRKIYLLAFALIGAISNVFTAQAEDVELTLSETGNFISGFSSTGICGNEDGVPGFFIPEASALNSVFANDAYVSGTSLVWGTAQGKNPGNDFSKTTTNGFSFYGRKGYQGEFVGQTYVLTGSLQEVIVSFEISGDVANTSFSIWSISGGSATMLKSCERGWVAGAHSFTVEGLSLNADDRLVFIWAASSPGTAVNVKNFAAFYSQSNLTKTTLSYKLTDGTNTWNGTYEGVKGASVPAFTGAYGMTLTDGSWENDTYKATVNFPFPVGKSTTIMSALGTTSYLYGKDNVVKADPKGGNEEILPTDENGADYLWNIIPVFDGTNVSFKLQNIGKSSYISSLNAALVEEASAGKFTYSETGINSGVGFEVLGSTGKFLSLGSSDANDKTIEIWTKTTGSTHKGANLSFRDIQAEFDALPKSESNKFDLVAGATVISPKEYAAPSVINAAIAAAAACDTDAKKVAFLLGTNGTNLTQFKNASATNGNPVSFTYTIKGGKWGTLFSQVNFTKPEEWTLYQCAEHTDGVLTLTEYTAGQNKNRPYLVKTTATEDKTYQIIGYANGAATANTKIGLLTGVIVENTEIPVNSYILASKGDVQAFHKVTTNEMTAQLNKAFLTLPTGESTARSIIFIEDEATSINEIFGAEESVANNGKFVENGKVIIVKNGVKYNIAGQIVK